jgi:hypothetical protein
MAMMGMEMAARGQAGDPDGALALAKRAMLHFNTSRFWGQHYDCEYDNNIVLYAYICTGSMSAYSSLC